MSELKISTNCDSIEEMQAALQSRRTIKGPLPISTELVQRREGLPEETRRFTVVEQNVPGPDGGTEHGSLTTEVYHDGRLQPPGPPSPRTGLPHDAAGYGRRVAEAREELADWDDVVGQENIMVPAVVATAALNNKNGARFAYFLGRNPAFCEELERVAKTDPERACLLAIEKSESLTDDDLAQWMSHKAYRKYRASNNE